MSGRILLTLFVLISFSARADTDWSTYLVQKGETLSSIAFRVLPQKSLWGEDGSVALIFEKNKDRIKNKNLIFPGQEILIPEVRREPAAVPTAEEPSQRSALITLGLFSSLKDKDLKDKTSGATGTLRSKPTLGIDLEFLFPVSDRWDLGSGLTYENIRFAGASNRALQVESQDFIRFRLGAVRVFEDSIFEAGVQYGQIPLVTGVSPTVIGVSSFNVFSPYLKEAWILRNYGKTRVSLAGKFNYFFSSSNEAYRLERGWTGELSLPLTRVFYGVTPFIEYGEWETNTVTHTDLVAGLKFLLIRAY